MYKIGEDDMVFCPYNRYHIVSKLRIQKHIIKCKRNYPDVKLATCFYNYTHRLKPEDMLKHYEICSHKTRIEGSRYSEPFCLTSANSSVKKDSFTEEFPDINVRPRIFSRPGSSSSSQTTGRSGQSDSSDLESETDHPQIEEDDNVSDDNLEPLPLPKTVSKAFVCVKQKPKTPGFGRQTEDDVSITDDNLEPFPLPKTVSKAFLCVKEKPEKLGSDISQSMRFGRRKNFFPLTSTIKSTRTACHSLPHSIEEQIKKRRDKAPVFFPLKSDASITSSMFDDISTMKSADFISEDGSCEDDNDGCNC